jgi:hypothetical protein
MKFQRVALIFDNRIRPDTTGWYCLRALQALVKVEHFLPAQIDEVPRHDFDLYLNIDDGLRYRLPADLRPCAWWAIDTHLDFPWYAQKAPDFDFVFAAQRDGAARLRQRGHNAHWLPLACDPAVHRKHSVGKAFDLCFVGNLFPGQRSRLIGLLQERFPNTFVGRRFFAEMAATYSASRIVFNRSIRTDINMRVFEALACGSLLLTNDLSSNGQEALFHANEHLITYGDAEEMLDKAAYYLEHEAERERIAGAGRVRALESHTYRHRLAAILETVQGAARTVSVSHHAAAAPPSATAPPHADECLATRTIMNLIPRTMGRVLLIGSDTREIRTALAALEATDVVEMSAAAAEDRASPSWTSPVAVDDLGGFELRFPGKPFDAIICLDAIPCAQDPEKFLNRVRDWLVAQGVLIACIPNPRNHVVLATLLDGTPTSQSSERFLNLRWFNRHCLEQAFRKAGWAQLRIETVTGQGRDDWQAQGCPAEVLIGRHRIRDLSPAEAEELFIEFYVIAAKPRLPNDVETVDSDPRTFGECPKALDVRFELSAASGS